MRTLFATSLALLLLARPAAAEGEDWVEARMRNARKGKREIVRIPLATASMGWGCDCPSDYMGTSSDSAEGPFLSLTAEKHVQFEDGGRLGAVSVAEGYFTGKKEIYKSSDGEPGEEEKYDMLGFHVIKARPFSERDEGIEPKVLLTGSEAKRTVPLLAGDRPWILLAGSVPMAGKRSEATAQKLRDKLRKKGFDKAEIFDSRQIPRLACCYRVVLVDRFKSKAEAKKARKAARKQKVRVQLRQGW